MTTTTKDFETILTQVLTNYSKKSKKISSMVSTEELKNRIKTAITKREIKQVEIAKGMGMSYPSINAKINGKKSFTLSEAFRLAEILKTPFEELYFKYP